MSWKILHCAEIRSLLISHPCHFAKLWNQKDLLGLFNIGVCFSEFTCMQEQRLSHIYDLDPVALLVVVSETDLLVCLLAEECWSRSLGSVNSIDLVDSVVIVFGYDWFSNDYVLLGWVCSHKLKSCLFSEDSTSIIDHQIKLAGGGMGSKLESFVGF